MSHLARIEAAGDGFYIVRACNTFAGNIWYIARLFRTLRAARMFCKREHLTVIATEQS